MRITVKVMLHAKRNTIEELERNKYKVRLCAPPVKGEANKELIKMLGEYFHSPKSLITIVRGIHGRTKIVDIDL